MIRHHEQVRPEWIDYNGHLSEPYYVLVFGHATDVLMEHVGLGPAYRAATGGSLYTVEAHVRYLSEVGDGEEMAVVTRVLGVDAKRVHYVHEMSVAGQVVSTEELLGVHVAGDGSTPLPPATLDALTRLVEPAPEYAGRAIAMPRARSDARGPGEESRPPTETSVK